MEIFLALFQEKKENACDLYLDIALLFRYKILSQFLVSQTILLSKNDECFDSMVFFKGILDFMTSFECYA